MYAASLILLVAAGVTLALGIRGGGTGSLFLSIGCSALAAASVAIAVVRRLRRAGPAPGD